MKPLILDMCRKRNTVSPVFTLTATTTAAGQTVTLQKINPQSAISIGWGDGTTASVPAGNAAVFTHTYASAGVYSITFPRVTYTEINLQDSKIGGTVTAVNPFPAVTGSVYLYNLPGLTWLVSSSAPFPAVTGSVTLYNLPGLTWPVSSSAPFPAMTGNVYLYNLPGLTWPVSSSNPFPAVTGNVYLYNLPGLTWPVSSSTPFPAVTGYINLSNLPGLSWGSGAALKLTACGDITYKNNLLQTAVDAVLADLWAMFPNRTKTGYTIDVSTTNSAPSAAGLVYANKLVNDPDNVNPTHKWAACTVTTG